MKQNKFQQILKAGGSPAGHMIMEFGTRGIARILEAAGLDYVIVDMEHTGFDADRIADLMSWFRATTIAPFVRVPQGLYHFIARTLDAGALGIMVGNVESGAQARTIVDAAKYAPLGRRGVGLGTAHNDYRAVDPDTYFAEANANTTVICQIESTSGLENLDAIAATPGVDILWVGHYDLSQSMGIPGRFEHPRFQEALRQVVAAAARHDKLAAVQPGNLQQAENWLRLGFRVLSWKTDIALYRDALAGELEELRKLRAAVSAAAQ